MRQDAPLQREERVWARSSHVLAQRLSLSAHNYFVLMKLEANPGLCHWAACAALSAWLDAEDDIGTEAEVRDIKIQPSEPLQWKKSKNTTVLIH